MKKRDIFTLFGAMALESFVIEHFKGKHYSLKDVDVNDKFLQAINDKIDNEGLFHFTSSKALNKISESKKLKTSKGIFRNHSTDGDRAYMFGGVPEMHMYEKNLTFDTDPFLKKNKSKLTKDKNMVLTALHIDKDEEDIDRLSARVEDGIVTYKGAMNLEEKMKEGKVDIAYFVMELDKDGKMFLSEKFRQKMDKEIAQEQIDAKIEELSKEYLPSEELLQQVDKKRTNILGESYRQINIERDVASVYIKEWFKKKINNFKARFNKNKALPESKEEMVETKDSDSEVKDFFAGLEADTYPPKEALENSIKRENESKVKENQIIDSPTIDE